MRTHNSNTQSRDNRATNQSTLSLHTDYSQTFPPNQSQTLNQRKDVDAGNDSSNLRTPHSLHQERIEVASGLPSTTVNALRNVIQQKKASLDRLDRRKRRNASV